MIFIGGHQSGHPLNKRVMIVDFKNTFGAGLITLLFFEDTFHMHIHIRITRDQTHRTIGQTIGYTHIFNFINKNIFLLPDQLIDLALNLCVWCVLIVLVFHFEF